MKEPFRVFFPLGALLGLAGVAPWLLFGLGFIRAWPGSYHALVMTQAFMPAVAVGFLGTMIPRRTGGAPLSSWELAFAALGLAVIPPALALDRLGVAEVGYLVTLATTVQFLVRRAAARRVTRPLPPSFAFLPAGLLAGVGGAALLSAFSLGAPAWCLAAGRSLVEEGLLVGFVLALAPMLTPLIAHDRVPVDVTARGPLRVYAAAAALFLGSFALQHGVDERAGLIARGLVTAGVLAAARVFAAPTVPGLHRWLYHLSLLLVPLGPLAAGMLPPLRVPLMHLSFIGGLSLLVFAVSMHVTFLHTGREALARRRPWPVLLVGVATAAALIARLAADRLPQHYFQALTVASSLWLLAAAIWAVFVMVLLLRRVR